MKLSEKLQYIIKISSFTPSSLANALGVSKTVVNDWLKGTKEPTLAEYRLLSQQLGVTLDYLSEDNALTENDKKTDSLIQKQIDEEQTIKKCEELRQNCKNYLKHFKVSYDDCVLPSVKSGKIDYGCFDSNTNDFSLDLKKLVAAKQTDLIKVAFTNSLSLEQAIELDDIDLVKAALANYGPSKENRGYNGIREIDSLLENLNPGLKHYFEFIVMLIDAGANYVQQFGDGDDITVFSFEEDVSKTNFYYNVAKQMIRLSNKE